MVPDAVLPSVMLFPNARNCVAERRGADARVTVNAQEPVLKNPSVVVHVTVDVPGTKMAPLSGEHLVRNGGSPATTWGASYTTGVAFPAGDCTVRFAGQTRMGPNVCGLVGLPHPVARSAPKRKRRLRRGV